MKTSLALQHLLLRSAWLIRHQTQNLIYEEFARSLKVQSIDSGHEVTWMNHGILIRKIIPTEAFEFYIRSEHWENNSKISEQNLARALTFVAEALQVSAPTLDVYSDEVPNKPSELQLLLMAAALDLALTGSITFLWLSAAFWLERHLILSRYINPILFSVIALTNSFWAGAIGIAAYLVHQVLDPLPQARMARVISALIALIFSIQAGYAPPQIQPAFLLAGILALAIFIWRVARGVHRTWMSLFLPLIAVGLACDNQFISSFLLITSCIVFDLTKRVTLDYTTLYGWLKKRWFKSVA